MNCYKLQIMQNKVIRFVLQLGPRSHIGYNEHKSSGWLPVSSRVDQIKASHMYKIQNNLAPSYMESSKPVAQIHTHFTRLSVNSLQVTRAGSKGSSSFVRTGTDIWNALPPNVKNSPSLASFKPKLKKFLFNKLKDVEEDPFMYY